ncbi:cupin domain-containing protein [Candidatus Babeliales bacterium]|nr:cupin domain-containing protein [Candidatus Babeliales bacterium]
MNIRITIAIVAAVILIFAGGYLYKRWRSHHITAFHDNIMKRAQENDTYRTVVVTGAQSQLVLMALKPGEEIGEEVHQNTDQTFVFVAGKGTALAEDKTYNIDKEDVFFVPAGIKHNIKNTGTLPLKLYTIYAPPTHKDGTVHKTKADEPQE